jgi:hypothetical protein
VQPDLFAGIDINLPDLPRFGNITLPKLYLSGENQQLFFSAKSTFVGAHAA